MFVIWTLRSKYIPAQQYAFYMLLLLAFVIENGSALLVQFKYHTTWFYNFYLPLEVILLMVLAHGSVGKRWLRGTFIVALIAYFALWTMELFAAEPTELLNSKSTLFGWSILTLIYGGLLVQLADTSVVPLWKDQRFWTYLSVLIFVGPAIPYIGLINRIYAEDPGMASDLFVIIDVLFFVRYGCALIAGALLTPSRVAT